MNLVPYHKVNPEHKRFINTDVLMAKQGCRRCKGRGHVGYNPKRQRHIPCSCVMVDVDKLAVILNEKMKTFDTNIPSLNKADGSES